MFGRTIFLLLFLVSSSSNSFAGATSMPWSDPECYFFKELNKKGPRGLLNAFLASDGEGGFVNGGKLNEFALCPGHQGGGDSFDVVRSYTVVNESVGKDSADFSVRFEKLGTITIGGPDGNLNSFTKDLKSETVLFKLVKSPFGWRIDFPNTYVPKVNRKRADSYLPNKGWVESERKAFEDTKL